MSLDQSLSSKKAGVGEGGSDTSPKKSPSKLSLKILGRSSSSALRISKSPVRRQATLSDPGKVKKVQDLGEFIPGGSGPANVDSAYPSEVSQKQSKTTNKIITSWKSACKDKTKDLIRKWKTLPENHPDFETFKKEQTCGDSPCNSSQAGSSSNLACVNVNVNVESSNNVIMVNPSGSGGTMSGGSNTPILSGKLAKRKGESTTDVSAGVQRLSLGPRSSNGPFQEDQNGTKSSTGWSVHVWATYVQRGNDDVTLQEDKPPPRDFLSDFQKVKLTHFFRHVLDMNHDDVISAEDFVALNQRIRHYIEWSSECIEFHILKEVHSGFLECFLNQPLDDNSVMYYCNDERETRQNVNTNEWLDIWGNLLHNARTLESLPLWLQYFPKILFQVINKSGSGTISKQELRAFYTTFLGIDFRVVNETLDSIYNAMTDNGRNKITYSLFKLCFTNFLLGKYPHGPGQYLFGICSPDSLSCTFPIDYSALNTPKDDLEVYDPEKEKNQSNRRLE